MSRLLAVLSLAFVAGQAMAQVAVYGQCGGSGYTGSTACASGSTCVYSNPYYSQCLPGTASATPTATPTTSPVKTTTPVTSTAPVTSPTAKSLPAVGYNAMSNFGTNPNNVGAFSYRPKKLAASPALVLALHYCQGTAQAYYTGTKYASLAETYGYFVIYGNSPRSGGCWDVNTNATLTHNGGSDSLGLINAVRYAIANWGINPNQVFVTGSSSGAMMTNVMAGAYPDVFKAGAVDSGVPYGCFEGASSWNSQCAQGQLIKTAQQWGALVHAGYPGYTGAYPKMQVWHGTIDTTLYPQNFWEEIKQWTNVFGYSQTPVSNTSMAGFPSGYSNATYGPNFQAILAQNVGHTVPVFETSILTFFGII